MSIENLINGTGGYRGIFARNIHYMLTGREMMMQMGVGVPTNNLGMNPIEVKKTNGIELPTYEHQIHTHNDYGLTHYKEFGQELPSTTEYIRPNAFENAIADYHAENLGMKRF